MTGALIPQGPLHPEEFVGALLAGLLAAVFARRDPRRWAAAVMIGASCVLVQRQGAALVEGFSHHRHGLLAALTTVLVAGLAAAVRPRSPVVIAATVVAACAAVWMVVPDTEAPLIGGVVTAAAVSGVPSRSALSRWTNVLLVVPLVAAVVGSVGRPERLGLALGVAAVAGALVAMLSEAIRRAQRAGTPTTVVPSATSSITTAPAPTTAS